MKNALSNLWADLREKRIWPLPVVLLVALVAVPVLLRKSPEEPPPAPPAAQTRSAPEPEQLKGLATVKLEETEVEDGSSLDTFDPANPFRPPERVVKRSEEETVDGGTAADDGLSLADETVTGEPGGGDTGVSGGGAGGDTDDGGATGDGDGDGGDGGDGGTPTETTQYAYVIDVTFVNNGRTRRIKGMERLDMLPSAGSPLLLFLGVSTNGGNAVFLVDSTLETAGEGRCEPSDSECAFLHLGAGSEHMFTTEEGDSYELRIDQIRKVRVDDGPSSAGASKAGPKAGAALSAPAGRRAFASPLISDIVSVSSATGHGSNGRGDRR
jgi:hypothetical protein